MSIVPEKESAFFDIEAVKCQLTFVFVCPVGPSDDIRRYLISASCSVRHKASFCQYVVSGTSVISQVSILLRQVPMVVQS